jgi:hypothetical protein
VAPNPSCLGLVLVPCPASGQDVCPACPPRNGVGPSVSRPYPAFAGFQKLAKPIDDGASLSRHHTANFSFRLQAALSRAPTVAGWSEIVSPGTDRTRLRDIGENLWRLVTVRSARFPPTDRAEAPSCRRCLPRVSPTNEITDNKKCEKSHRSDLHMPTELSRVPVRVPLPAENMIRHPRCRALRHERHARLTALRLRSEPQTS